MGVDAQFGVMRQRLVAPHGRVAGVVAQAIEELGEIGVEIGQKGVHADHIGQRHAEVAAVFLHPGLQCRFLKTLELHADGLKRL